MRKLLPLCLLAACSTADYVEEADTQVYGILERAALAVTGDAKTFPVGLRDQTLRMQFANYPDVVTIDLAEALDIAAKNSRQFQQRRESLYLTALALTREQNDFAAIYGGGGDADVSGLSDETADLTLSDDLSASVNTVAGTRVVASFVNTFFRSLVNGGGFDSSSILNLTITQPLLRGLGSHIVRESLTQAERNVVYEVRAFERFRRSLAVQVTSEYLRIARQVRDLESEQANLLSVRTSREQIEALFNAGRRAIAQVDQALQNELSAENRLVNARNQLQTSLDNFKLTLGLPIDCEIEIDPNALARLRDLGVEPLELQESEAIQIALERRYDFQTALDEVEDSARRLIIAEDALRSSLDFSAAFSVPTDPNSPLDFDFSQISWSAGFGLDLALNRLPERNAYRSSLITLDVEMRNREQLEDTIRADVRASMRNIRARIESYRIQERATTLAERRVDSTSELYIAGRAEARDVLESQEDLLSARLSLSGALVEYAIARLALMRDLEVLALEPKGLRYDRSLPVPERLDEAAEEE